MRNSYADSKTPGPGNYEADASRIKSRDPSWSLSKGSRDYLSKSNVVGPGAYEVDKHYKSLVASNNGYNFGSQKRLKQEINSVPGPGQYDGELLKSRRNVRIGERLRDSDRNFVPGPGVTDI